MKYILRSIKYFLYISIIFSLILCVLVLIKAVDPDIAVMFKNGWTSLGQIALMFAGVSCFYPLFGYMKKDLLVTGDPQEARKTLIEVMENHNFRVETDTEDLLTFRRRNIDGRITRIFEDRISFASQYGGYKMEGLRRDVIRLYYGIDYKLNRAEEPNS